LSKSGDPTLASQSPAGAPGVRRPAVVGLYWRLTSSRTAWNCRIGGPRAHSRERARVLRAGRGHRRGSSWPDCGPDPDDHPAAGAHAVPDPGAPGLRSHSPPFPGWDREAVGPEPGPRCPRLRLQPAEPPVGRVPPEPPGEAGPDELLVEAPAIRQANLCQQAPMSITPCRLDGDHLPERERRRVLLRALPVSLPALRGVDAAEPDHLATAVPEHADRVAVGDADDRAGEGLRRRRPSPCPQRGAQQVQQRGPCQGQQRGPGQDQQRGASRRPQRGPCRD
jgi:hypothetical protein